MSDTLMNSDMDSITMQCKYFNIAITTIITG